MKKASWIRRHTAKLSILLILQSLYRANAFVTPSPYEQRHGSFVPARRPQSQLNVMEFQWDELVYNAESAASSFASQSLENPTALWSSLPVMYGAGLLTSVSPCVWGLLPLTMSYISSSASERADKQATLPTLAFAAGLASVFCTLGLIASSMGGVFGANSGGASDILVPLFSSTVCLAMGLQLLDLVNLPLLNLSTPFSQTNKVDDSPQLLIDERGQVISPAKEEKNGSLFKTFLLGGSSALVASPCATPVLTSILAYVAKSQDPALGFVLLLGYTLGYSTPLLLVAATGGQALANMRGDGYSKIAPWITPLTAGILLWYGTNGLLTALFGDPSLAGLAPILE
jgi:cytochrome c-type biogenesis protein